MIELKEETNAASKHKKEFMEIYEKVMKDEIDLKILPLETIDKISILLKEEIKIKKEYIKRLREKLRKS